MEKPVESSKELLKIIKKLQALDRKTISNANASLRKSNFKKYKQGFIHNSIHSLARDKQITCSYLINVLPIFTQNFLKFFYYRIRTNSPPFEVFILKRIPSRKIPFGTVHDTISDGKSFVFTIY